MLRASSPEKLDFPAIHELSRKCIENMFPSGPRPFVHPAHLEEALVIASEYKLPVSDFLRQIAAELDVKISPDTKRLAIQPCYNLRI